MRNILPIVNMPPLGSQSGTQMVPRVPDRQLLDRSGLFQIRWVSYPADLSDLSPLQFALSIEQALSIQPRTWNRKRCQEQRRGVACLCYSQTKIEKMEKQCFIYLILYCWLRVINGQGQGQQPPSYTPVEKGWSVWQAMTGQPQTATHLFNEWQGRDQPMAGSNFVSLPYVAGNSNGARPDYSIHYRARPYPRTLHARIPCKTTSSKKSL